MVRRDRVDELDLGRRQAQRSEMRADGDAHAFQHVEIPRGLGMVDRHARIIDRLVRHAERIGLRNPFEIVDRLRPALRARRVDLVDRHDLAFLAAQHVVVVVAPPGCGVGAEGFSLELGVGACPRNAVEDAHLQHVAGLGALHIDRPGHDMDALPLAGAFLIDLRVRRPGAAAIDAFLVLGPEEDALGPGIALHHALGVVIGVMGQRLDRDEVAALDLDPGLQRLREIAPMHRLGGGWQVMVLLFARRAGRARLRQSGADQRRRADAERREPAGGHE